MEITVTVRNVYGNEAIYPVNESAKLIAEIAGTKTLTPGVIALARKLGYSVVEVGRSHSYPPAVRAAVNCQESKGYVCDGRTFKTLTGASNYASMLFQKNGTVAGIELA